MKDFDLSKFGISWTTASNYMTTQGLDLVMGLLTALLIFYVGRWLARLLTRIFRRTLQASEVDHTLEQFLCNLVYMGLILFVVIAAISQLGVQTAQLIAVVGAAGLAIGLALQGSLSNFAAGVLIILLKPYRVGDYIEAAGVGGSVVQVQILTTEMKTPDNKKIVVPNSQIIGSVITNFSAENTRRVDMVIGVAYGDDLDKVRQVITRVVDAEKRVLSAPAPLIAVAELGDSSVNFFVRPWVNTADYWPVKFALTEEIKKQFDQEGISIPFPQHDVHIIGDVKAVD